MGSNGGGAKGGKSIRKKEKWGEGSLISGEKTEISNKSKARILSTRGFDEPQIGVRGEGKISQ